MNWSFNLGKISGVKIKMHWTFLLLIAWIAFAELSRGSPASQILLTIGYVLSIFLCVILHEFGHILTARRFGISTRRITLLPIGGVAQLEQMPEKPQQEFLVAIAGPLVNVAIAAILLFIGPFTLSDLTNPERLEALVNITPQNFLFALCFINVILVVFNAIPAFPMDGGRILRALLSLQMSRTQATKIASGLGQILGFIFILMGFMGNILLIFIGLFVMAGAYSENMMVQQMELLKDHVVKEAMMTNYTVLRPEEPLQVAVDKLLAGPENNFIVSENDHVQGILSKARLVEALKSKGKDTKIKDVMAHDFRPFEANEQLTNVLKTVQRDKQRFYPVTENGNIVGVIDMDNLQEFIMIQSATG